MEYETPKKNYWSLISGLLFIGLGGYRVYGHFFSDGIGYSNFRLLLAVVFIAYGAFRLYTYLSQD